MRSSSLYAAALLLCLPAASCLHMSAGKVSRKSLVRTAFWAPSIAILASSSAASAAGEGPVVVLGAGGKTGREAVLYASKMGMSVRAATRSGSVPEGLAAAGVEGVKGDVTKPDELLAAVKGASAVIFAASASQKKEFAKESNAFAVDCEGVKNAARACLEAKVPRLVIVSSGGVSKPDSLVYKGLNLFGRIMDAKIEGEDAVRAMYAKSGADAGATYTIVRPGGLTEEPSKGPSALELNQGDTKSGRIARADVAALCVECVTEKSAANCTFECYEKGSAQPIGSVGLNNLFKGGASDMTSGLECQGGTWPELVKGLKGDASLATA